MQVTTYDGILIENELPIGGCRMTNNKIIGSQEPSPWRGALHYALAKDEVTTAKPSRSHPRVCVRERGEFSGRALRRPSSLTHILHRPERRKRVLLQHEILLCGRFCFLTPAAIRPRLDRESCNSLQARRGVAELTLQSRSILQSVCYGVVLNQTIPGQPAWPYLSCCLLLLCLFFIMCPCG